MRINFEFIEFPTLKVGENGTKWATKKKVVRLGQNLVPGYFRGGWLKNEVHFWKFQHSDTKMMKRVKRGKTMKLSDWDEIWYQHNYWGSIHEWSPLTEILNLRPLKWGNGRKGGKTLKELKFGIRIKFGTWIFFENSKVSSH